MTRTDHSVAQHTLLREHRGLKYDAWCDWCHGMSFTIYGQAPRLGTATGRNRDIRNTTTGPEATSRLIMASCLAGTWNTNTTTDVL